jgi:protein O-GlcNAc transferase
MRRRLTILAVALAIGCAAGGCRRDPVDQGLQALERGDAARAERLFEQAIQIQPADASAWANLGLARLKLGRPDDAAKAFREAAELDRDDARPLEFIASIHSERGQWKAALDTLNEAVRRDAASPRLLTALAVAESHVHGPQTARSRLADILTRAPNYSPAVFNMAALYRDALHNPAEAEKYFRRYLKLAPSDPHAAEAQAALQATGTTATPPAAPPPVTPSRTPAPVRPAPAPVVINPQAAAEAYNRGVRSQAAGDLDRALQEYSRALQNNPSMASAHYNLGLTYRAKGDTAAARAAFQQALTHAPDMANARYMLALAHRELGDDAAAAAELNALLLQQPKHADAHLALGLLYKKDSGRVTDARRELTRYLELAPNGASARDVRAWLKYQQKPR